MPATVRRDHLKRDHAPLARRVQSWANRMLAALAMPEAELSIVLTDDRTIHDLNRTFRGMDKPTDVLAFAVRDAIASGVPASALPDGVLGDVVISVPTAARQAQAARRTADAEIAMLLAHGLLHLLGRDHRDRTEERRMTAMTDALRSTSRASAMRASARPAAATAQPSRRATQTRAAKVTTPQGGSRVDRSKTARTAAGRTK